MFGGQAMATKAFIMILFVSLVVRLLYIFNFSLPQINVRISEEKAPAKNKKQTSHISYTPEDPISQES